MSSEGGIQPSDSDMMLSEGGILHSMGSTTSPEGSNAEVGCICTCAREHHCFISCKRLGGLGSNLVCGGVCGCEVCGREINLRPGGGGGVILAPPVVFRG